MDQQIETVIASLKIEFEETDIACLFAKVYDYYFAPRNPKTRAAAAKSIAATVQMYEEEKQLSEWLMQALANKQRSSVTVTLGSTQNLAHSIEKVLDSNHSFVRSLTSRPITQEHGLPILWILVFTEVHSEFPKNKPGTPSYYAIGATDDRWENLLHKRDAADDKTGYRYMLEALKRHGVTL